MTTFVLSALLFLAVFAAVSCAVLYFRANLVAQKAEKLAEESQDEARKFEDDFLKIKKAPKLVLENAKIEAARLVEEAESKSNGIIQVAEQKRDNVLLDAKEKLTELTARAKRLETTAKAYENKINGYGDEYLIPIESVIDQLAKELAYAEPSKQFQEVKKRIKSSIKNGEAAKSRLAEEARKEKALEFILDAFLGKAETIIGKVKSDNYGKLKQELIDSYNLVNINGDAFGTQIKSEFLDLYQDKLKWASILQKIKKDQQEEQRRIRERMREEERVRKEAERVQKEALKEEEAVQKALAIAYEKMAKATEEQKAKYEQEIGELNRRVSEAEEKRQRAISMAQQTKMGHVYVISNIGSFGEDVFKIGLTRRLEPQDRIDELGDSSVPFEFDVHALIKSDDAPALEHMLHKHFVLNQVNKVNHRKEFFRVPLTKIREEVEKLGLEATWTMAAEAVQFKESQFIDKLIETDPEAREKWISRQLELDDIDLKGGMIADPGDHEEDD
jgi:hypothetical protein